MSFSFFPLPEVAHLILGVAGWATLVILPGAWLTFGLSLTGCPFRVRLLTGMVLSPLIVGLQFYLFRLLGAPFDLAIPLIVAVNIPVLYLIWKRRSEFFLPDRRALVGIAGVFFLAVIALSPQLLNNQARAFTGHAWMHADIIYMLANGELFLEDPELAGVRLAYPWVGHVLQAGLSYFLDSAPVSSYIWTNLLWLLCVCGFIYHIVAEFGGTRLSRITSVIWLFFGLNFAGYLLQQSVPEEIVQKLWIGGDYRYTPWILKFYFFEQIIFGIGMFSALVYVLIKEWVVGLTKSHLVLIFALLLGIGVVYPILLAPAGFIVFGRALAPKFGSTWDPIPAWRREFAGLGTVLLAAGLITFAYIEFLTADRATAAIHLPHFTGHFAKLVLLKSFGSVIALGLFAVSFWLVFRRYQVVMRNAIIVLTVGAVGSLLLNVLLEIPYWGNEYKFLFTAAICLAPFPALALEPLISRLGRKRKAAAIALITIVLAAPFAHKIYKDYPWQRAFKHSPGLPVPHPVVDTSTFDLRLDIREQFALLCDAIRHATPADTLLLVEKTELHFPTLTRRRLYSPPDQEEPRPGVNISSPDLIEGVKGYDGQVVENRRLNTERFFNTSDANGRRETLEEIQRLNRPIAVILELPRQEALRDWLAADGQNQLVYKDAIVELWLIKP